MRLRISIFIALFCLVGIALGCKPSRAVTIDHGTDRKEIFRDTVFMTQKDSATIKALLECRDGKVQFAKSKTDPKGNGATKPVSAQENRGRKTTADLTLHADGTIECDCQAEAEAIAAKMKEVWIKEWSKTHTVEQLSNWQVVQLWCGRVFLAIVGALLIFIALKAFK